MLKCILLLLSEYYYELTTLRLDEIREKVKGHQVDVVLKKFPEDYREEGGRYGNENMCPLDELYMEETLVITDEPEAVKNLLNRGWYVVILYHEKNQGKIFEAVRYGVEDLFQLEYRSYEEAFRRLAGLPWDILETDRLKVRESTVEDVDEFYRIYEEPSITLYMEDLYQEREEEQAYMKAYIDQVYGFYGYGLWTVILKETGQVIGRAGLSVREGCELPELGFMIGAEYQNKGYGFEVCRAILTYARKELAFEKVQALVNRENTISRHLLDKLGFVFHCDVVGTGQEYQLFVKEI